MIEGERINPQLVISLVKAKMASGILIIDQDQEKKFQILQNRSNWVDCYKKKLESDLFLGEIAAVEFAL